MLFHLSISAREPRRVAEVIAEIWGGVALPFPPVSDDGWMALAGDDRGTGIEVYPLGTVLAESDGDADAHGLSGGATGLTPTHCAIATDLELDEILAIAAREGWSAKYRRRGGIFGVVEMWIEGRQMIEVLTPAMQAEYRASLTPANWQRMLDTVLEPA